MRKKLLDQYRYDIREYESANLIAELVGEARLVLNVGPFWGRDFYALSERGKTVINMDIAPQHHLPLLVQADITQGIPFPRGTFDAVVLAEVLEHLVEDWIALQEAHRVLKDEGRLIVTVPFYHDKPPYHIRIHSFKTIMRLLAVSGFKVERVIFRGGWIRFPRLVHALRKLLLPMRGDLMLYRMIVAMDRWWGEKSWSQRRAQGAYLLAHKSSPLDWRRLNMTTFQHK